MFPILNLILTLCLTICSWRHLFFGVESFVLRNFGTCAKFYRGYVTIRINTKKQVNDVTATKTVRKRRRKKVNAGIDAGTRKEETQQLCNEFLQFSSPSPPASFVPNTSSIQACGTPRQVLEKVGHYISVSTNLDIALTSLVLVRLSKQLISIDNDANHSTEISVGSTHITKIALVEHFGSVSDVTMLSSVFIKFAKAIKSTINSATGGKSDKDSLDAIVQGTKASSTIARILCKWFAPNYAQSDELQNLWIPIVRAWNEALDSLDEENQEMLLWKIFQKHHVVGLKWAFDTFEFVASSTTIQIPMMKGKRTKYILDMMYKKLDIPFCVYPGLMLLSPTENHEDHLSVSKLQKEVEFGVDEIIPTITTNFSLELIPERRQTAWQGDSEVFGFAYSGKIMNRYDWSPTVLTARNRLHLLINQYYDCCLLNLYHKSTSGMRYHIDPDQGKLWDYDTSVVSVGASRRFAFREIEMVNQSPYTMSSTKSSTSHPHNFVIMDGDVTHMFNDCQQRFQHTVKKAENKFETAMRASLVFKRSFYKDT